MEPFATLRTKPVLKLASWIAREESVIKKRGIKALKVAELRSWPALVPTEASPAESVNEKASKPVSAHDPQSEASSETKDFDAQNADREGPVGTSEAGTAPETVTLEAETATRDKTGFSRQAPIIASVGDHQFEEDGDAADEDVGYDEDATQDDQQLEDGAATRRHHGHRRDAKTSDGRELSTQRGPTRSQPNTAPPPQSGERMRSYVEHSLDRRERERQRNQAQEDGAAAEEIVVEWEQKRGRSAKRLGGNNPGYDIASKSTGGTDERYIEVKSIAGEWGGTGVRLTPTQFAYAEQLGDRYWLYVVEDAKTKQPIIHAIQNPAAHISAFCFDCGWREIAEAETSAKPPSLFVPKVGDTVLFDEHEVIVAKVETRGAFVLATFTLDGRTYRKMNTALLPKE